MSHSDYALALIGTEPRAAGPRRMLWDLRAQESECLASGS